MEIDDAPPEPRDWFVFETFGADGTLATGVARGTPEPSAGMVIATGLTRRAAHEVARRRVAEHREAGLTLDAVDSQGMPPDPGDGWRR